MGGKDGPQEPRRSSEGRKRDVGTDPCKTLFRGFRRNDRSRATVQQQVHVTVTWIDRRAMSLPFVLLGSWGNRIPQTTLVPPSALPYESFHLVRLRSGSHTSIGPTSRRKTQHGRCTRFPDGSQEMTHRTVAAGPQDAEEDEAMEGRGLETRIVGRICFGWHDLVRIRSPPQNDPHPTPLGSIDLPFERSNGHETCLPRSGHVESFVSPLHVRWTRGMQRSFRARLGNDASGVQRMRFHCSDAKGAASKDVIRRPRPSNPSFRRVLRSLSTCDTSAARKTKLKRAKECLEP